MISDDNGDEINRKTYAVVMSKDKDNYRDIEREEMEGKKGIRKLYINLISDDDDAKLMLKLRDVMT